jgi:hypothetical protein
MKTKSIDFEKPAKYTYIIICDNDSPFAKALDPTASIAQVRMVSQEFDDLEECQKSLLKALEEISLVESPVLGPQIIAVDHDGDGEETPLVSFYIADALLLKNESAVSYSTRAIITQVSEELSEES